MKRLLTRGTVSIRRGSISCFHGLILLFERLGEATAYLPVRFDSVRYFGRSTSLAGARIKLRRADARAIVADFNLIDAEGRTVAALKGGRYQPARAKPRAKLADLGLVQQWIPGTADMAGHASHVRLPDPSPAAEAEAELSPDTVLIEGWANAAALELARDLAVDGVVDLGELVLSGRLPSEKRRWIADAFDVLCGSGFLTRQGSAYCLTGDALPPAEAVLESLATQFPERSAELLLAAHVGSILRAFGAGGGPLTHPSRPACDAYALRSIGATQAAKTLRRRLDAVLPAGTEGPSTRILLVGATAAAAELSEFATSRNARLAIFDEDERRLERARHKFAQDSDTVFVDALDSLPDRAFDIIASSGGLSRLCSRWKALDAVADKCAPGAMVLAEEPALSRFASFALGLADDAGEESDCCGVSAKTWIARLTQAKFNAPDARDRANGPDRTIAIAAQFPMESAIVRQLFRANILIAHASGDRFAKTLAKGLARHGASCTLLPREDTEAIAQIGLGVLVWLPHSSGGDPVARVAAECLALRGLLLALGGRKIRVVAAIDGADRAFAAAIASFLRTVANEAPALDIRRVEISRATKQRRIGWRRSSFPQATRRTSPWSQARPRCFDFIG